MSCWFLVVLDNKKRSLVKSSQFSLWHLKELKLDLWYFIYYQFNSHSPFTFCGMFCGLLILNHQNIIMHIHFFHAGVYISHSWTKNNLFCVLQILYDLGSFNFYTETYSEALLMFTQCLNTITEVCTGIHLLFLHFHPTNTLPQVTVSLIIWFK